MALLMDHLEAHRLAFAPGELSVLDHVLEEACRQLLLYDATAFNDLGHLRSSLAKEIIAIAAQGEKDPALVTSIALKRIVAGRINKEMRALRTKITAIGRAEQISRSSFRPHPQF